MYERAAYSVNGPVDIGDVSPRRYFAAVAVVFGLLFALVAAEDETAASFTISLVRWQLQSWIPISLLLMAHMLWSRLRWFERRQPWTQLLISGVAGSLLFAPLALAIDVYLAGDVESFSGSEVLGEFWNLWPPVTLTWMAINAPFVLGLRLRGSRDAKQSVRDSRDGQESPEREAAAPKVGDSQIATLEFMNLVPADQRGPVLYLQAELHYLAVVTTRGRSLILYNLRDAMDEMAGVSGLQIHRSYWVATDGVLRYKRSGRQGVLEMRNGDKVPVSRRRLEATAEMFRAGSG